MFSSSIMTKSARSVHGCEPARQHPIRPEMQKLWPKVVQLPRKQRTRLGFASRWVRWDRGSLVSAPAPKVVVKDTVGAGDAFMAGLMVGLTRGTDTRKVLENACRLGGFGASHDGATPLFTPEIVGLFAQR